ncbi:MAG: ABC transporter ATP-binding protein [Oscillospiraceae bacterium]|jgi:NitT/TauT family transport system ATP-binding protein/sulfonate transport system ATP-binding protein|nr:ABC transporter ATP-binding protein [Oscillospiraceae bacterium]
MAEVILEIKDVNRTYYDDDGGKVVALKDIGLSVKQGEFVSFIGASGCGKTTLIRLIAGLDEPESGKLLLDGKEIVGTSPQRGYVFQQGGLFPWRTVEGNIKFGLQVQGKKDKTKVQHYVDLIGLSGFEKSFPHQISGGMAQRVAIARALINNPEVLLLDEPMGALDSFTRADIQDKLLELRAEHNTTMLLVTHDIDEAIYLSDRVVIMTPRPGKIQDILEINIAHPRDRGSSEFLTLRKEILEKLQFASVAPQPEYTI